MRVAVLKLLITQPLFCPIFSNFHIYIVQLYMYFPTLLKSNYAIERKLKNFLEHSALVFSRPIKKSFLRRGFVCDERFGIFFVIWKFLPDPTPPPQLYMLATALCLPSRMKKQHKHL